MEHSPMTCCTAAGPVDGVWREIVGVVADVRQGNLDEAPADTIYRPYTQIVEHDMYLMVRARGADDAARLVAGLGPSLRTLDPAKRWWNVGLMRDTIRDSGSVRLRRFVLTLLGIFATLALLLAAVGIYGVTAHVVAQRTREMGIRAALGATRGAILRHVLRETMGLAVLGLAAGALAARAGARFIEHMLFGVGTADLLTYVSVALLLGLVAILGAYFPARRAGRIDPVAALRHE
jgi:ABC-type antimicrobial peptide transport system permease subunit